MTHRIANKFIILATIAIGLFFGGQGDSLAQEEGKAQQPALEYQVKQDERMAWWRDARFGMFIHWGIYSVPAGGYKGAPIKGLGEWIMDKAAIPVTEYETFAAEFNPVDFNADSWVAAAKGAGMKYIVITAKHHDGFCLWDSKLTEYDIVDATPFKRDILKEIAVACQKQGLVLGFYYSIMDWHHPWAKGENFPKYRDHYMKKQLKELLTGYGPIGILWFDGEWIPEWTEEQGKELYSFVRELQPQIIINNRVGKGRKGREGFNKGKGYAGDFGTPEQEIPATGIAGVDWESCMTMNDTWGFKSADDHWKSATTLIQFLVDTASKGGNLLLNVGPTAVGRIPEPSLARLEKIGGWLATNGESIYGTSASPFSQPSWGRYTKKAGRLYAHIFFRPENNLVKVPLRAERLSNSYLLSDATREQLKMDQAGDETVFFLSSRNPAPEVSVIAMELKDSKGP